MAQLSKPLILEAIRYIDEKRMHHLTLGEIRQLCFAWLHLHGHWKPDEPEPSIPTHEELVAIREIDAR